MFLGETSLHSNKIKKLIYSGFGFFAITLLAFLIWVVSAIIGVETRTEEPNPEQVEFAREFMFINPELDIAPLAYYEKDGMDYQVRFKFVAKTDDLSEIFNASQVDSSLFIASYDFPRGEETHNESWWDIRSQDTTGGTFWVPVSNTISYQQNIGIVANDDGSMTVYSWRHETRRLND